MNRRAFIKMVGVIAGSLALPVVPAGVVNLAGGSVAVPTNNRLSVTIMEAIRRRMTATTPRFRPDLPVKRKPAIEWVTWTVDTAIPEGA